MSDHLTEQASEPLHDIDVAIVGAGFGGLFALHELRGRGLKCRLYEAGAGVGGTWYWNRYPGARVDIESIEYSYSFSSELQQEWDWSERYPSQEEVERYLNHVADRFDLRRDIELSTRIVGAAFDESAATWLVKTDKGDEVRARFVVMAVGLLSAFNWPDIKGFDTFKGRLLHSGAWPREKVTLAGKRVGLIGTGASGVQMIPLIAEEAGQFFVYQRSPHWCVPLRNGPMSADYLRRVRENYDVLRERELLAFGGYIALNFDWPLPNAATTTTPTTKGALEVSEDERLQEYELRWANGGICFYHSFPDLLFNPESNETLAEFFRQKIRARVNDPAVAEALIPKDHPILSKRLCGENGYYEAFNRDNVHLVNVREDPIAEITPAGVRLGSGKEFELDVIVCATGWDAATGPLVRMDIRGRGGKALRDHWGEGPRTHLGMMSHDFPNLFIMDGPQTPAAFFQPVLLCEFQGRWIGDCIMDLDERGVRAIEPTAGAESDWVAHVAEVGDRTLIPQANSWYMGANVKGKPRQILYYIGGFHEYRRRAESTAAQGFSDEFLLSGEAPVSVAS